MRSKCCHPSQVCKAEDRSDLCTSANQAAAESTTQCGRRANRRGESPNLQKAESIRAIHASSLVGSPSNLGKSEARGSRSNTELLCHWSALAVFVLLLLETDSSVAFIDATTSVRRRSGRRVAENATRSGCGLLRMSLSLQERTARYGASDAHVISMKVIQAVRVRGKGRAVGPGAMSADGRRSRGSRGLR